MHMRSFDKLLATTILALAAAACGGASAPPAAAPTTASSAAPSDSTAPAAPAPSASSSASGAAAADASLPTAWSTTMPKEAQIAYMKKNVAPRMAKVFQGANASHYADFGCKSCHGPEYKAPKDYLPHLTMKDGKMTAFTEKPEVSKFMAEHVVPEMASAMGQAPYDPKTHQGFGCGGCHAVDMK
jgi:hypothetical protein